MSTASANQLIRIGDPYDSTLFILGDYIDFIYQELIPKVTEQQMYRITPAVGFKVRNTDRGFNYKWSGVDWLLFPDIVGSGGGTDHYTDLWVSGLTQPRVVYVGLQGKLVDSANMTFDGTSLTVAGNITSGMTVHAATDVTAGRDVTAVRNIIAGNNVTATNSAYSLNADSWFNGVRIGRGVGNISSNTVTGNSALNYNTTGTYNTAIGYQTLLVNSTGSKNTGVGFNVLGANRTGNNNTAIGYQSSNLNLSGSDNTSLGIYSLFSNSSGTNNVAVGNSALYSLNDVVNTTRRTQQPIRLQNGTVLIAGVGFTATFSDPDLTNTAEIYTPSTNTTHITAHPSNELREEHSTTLLPDGNVLLVGGYRFDLGHKWEESTTAELFNPITETFTFTSAPNTPRYAHDAFLIGNLVYLIGGQRYTYDGFGTQIGSEPVIATEIYNTSTQMFSYSYDIIPPAQDFWPSGGILLSDTSIFYLGTVWNEIAQQALLEAYLYNPTTGIFTASQSVPIHRGRAEYGISDIGGGKLLIYGGWNQFDPSQTPILQAEVYDSVTDTFSAVGLMTSPRLNAGCSSSVYRDTNTNHFSILIFGGNTTTEYTEFPSITAEIYDTVTQTFHATAGKLNIGRSGAAAVVLPDAELDRILIVGGYDVHPVPPTNALSRWNVGPKEIFTVGIDQFSLIAFENKGNVAVGSYSLYNSTKGNYNTALGTNAAYGDIQYTNTELVAIGHNAFYNSGGDYNIAIGNDAAYNPLSPQLSSLTNTIFIGHSATSTANAIHNSIAIGYNAYVTGSDQVTIGNSDITNTYLFGAVTATSFNAMTGLSDTNPLMDGVANPGSSTTVSRYNHVHPTDTSRAADVVFGPSGVNHVKGLVPDPGAVAGTTKYLREDATWQTPPFTPSWRMRRALF